MQQRQQRLLAAQVGSSSTLSQAGAERTSGEHLRASAAPSSEFAVKGHTVMQL